MKAVEVAAVAAAFAIGCQSQPTGGAQIAAHEPAADESSSSRPDSRGAVRATAIATVPGGIGNAVAHVVGTTETTVIVTASVVADRDSEVPGTVITCSTVQTVNDRRGEAVSIRVKEYLFSFRPRMSWRRVEGPGDLQWSISDARTGEPLEDSGGGAEELDESQESR